VPTAILIKGGRIDIVYGTDLVLGLESALAGGMRWYMSGTRINVVRWVNYEIV
jgi:hypothetical protein